MIRAGVDWGSSALRAYRFDDSFAVLEEISTPRGIRELGASSSSAYEHALFDTIGHWLTPGDSVLLSGMITSRSGWQETPYLECPANVSDVAAHALSIVVRGIELLFLPGIKQQSPKPDVMRGEELQLLGATLTKTSGIVVLPGTHSKWAVMNSGVLQRFHTMMTGELFEIILRHSMVGAIASSNEFDRESYLTGVESGFTSGTLLNDMFALRASVLLERADSSALHSRLSGMLIGREIGEGMLMLPTAKNSKITLVGSAELCSLYEMAFHCLNIPVTTAADTAAIVGFQHIARTHTPTVPPSV